MLVTKIGNDLALRLPQDLVEAMGLRESDAVDLKPAGNKALEVARVGSTGTITDMDER